MLIFVGARQSGVEEYSGQGDGRGVQVQGWGTVVGAGIVSL